MVAARRSAAVVVAACAAVVAAASTAAATPAVLHKLNTSVGAHPSARCLDGSPGAFYYRAASAAANATRWVFSLQGGGECVDEGSCTSRAGTGLGSSKAYAASVGDLPQLQEANAASNPDFWTWNHVFVQYCSGDLHMGSMRGPSDAAWGLQFSGHHIVDAVLDTLVAEHGLADADMVVWSGDSAGGIGSFAHLDFVGDKLAGLGSKSRVVGAPIGGFYWSNNWTYPAGSTPPPAPFIPWDFVNTAKYFSLWGGGGLPSGLPPAGSSDVAFVPTRCRAAGSAAAGNPWACMFANASYPTLDHPNGEGRVFFIEGQTDRVVMPLHNGLPSVWDAKGGDKQCDNTVKGCPPDIVNYMGTWSGHMVHALQQVVHSGPSAAKGGDGVFNPACLIHTSFSASAPRIGGRTYIQAFGDWLFGRNEAAGIHDVDTCGVMCNPTC